MATDLSFSVIIPTFNREIFLLDAVRSAVNSRPKNAEIIVVNDGNELLESTKNILDNLNVTTLETEGGVGASEARNYGAKHATGQWLLFLDDDDLIQNGYWKTLSEFLLHGNKTHHRSYGFCSMIAESNREEMHRIANKEVKNIDYIHKFSYKQKTNSRCHKTPVREHSKYRILYYRVQRQFVWPLLFETYPPPAEFCLGFQILETRFE